MISGSEWKTSDRLFVLVAEATARPSPRQRHDPQRNPYPASDLNRCHRSTAMNSQRFLIPVISSLIAAAAHAGPRTSASYTIATDTVDAGGKRANSASYTNDGSAGVVSAEPDLTPGTYVTSGGYVAELNEVIGLTLSAAQPSVNEGASVQLGAWQLLDDATYVAVNAVAITWGAAVSPIASIDASGLATAEVIYQDTPASVQGSYGGFSHSLDLSVRNVALDDFGMYAADGIDDSWQVQYFGRDNPRAGANEDPDGDGETNLFEYTAGLIPTDSSSVFRLRLEPVPGEPGQKYLIFSPRLSGRTYVIEALLDLLDGTWQPISSTFETDNGSERTVTDVSAASARKYYRVKITRP
ncbi:MAG: hypothetical protein ABIS29_12560 [Vicinamibacterales bacterium]